VAAIRHLKVVLLPLPMDLESPAHRGRGGPSFCPLGHTQGGPKRDRCA
jgi:hypothetical protein